MVTNKEVKAKTISTAMVVALPHGILDFLICNPYAWTFLLMGELLPERSIVSNHFSACSRVMKKLATMCGKALFTASYTL